MAFVHGKNSYLALDNSGGTLTDLSSYLDTVTFPVNDEQATVTAFGDGGTKTITGLENTTVSISGHFDATGLAVITAAKGNERTVEYGPAGNGSGATKFSGELLLTSYEIGSSVGDKVAMSAQFQLQGTVTVGTFA